MLDGLVDKAIGMLDAAGYAVISKSERDRLQEKAKLADKLQRENKRLKRRLEDDDGEDCCQALTRLREGVSSVTRHVRSVLDSRKR